MCHGMCPKSIHPKCLPRNLCFENLDRFFKLGLPVRELSYFFEVRHYEKYAQVCVCNAKLFESPS